MKWLIRRRRERVIAFVAPHAHPDEHPVVVLPTLMQGLHPGVFGLLPVVVFVVVLLVTRSLLFALVVEAAVLVVVVAAMQARAMVLTEARVIFLRCNPLLLHPRRIECVEPRAGVRVAQLRSGTLWGRIVLRRSDGDQHYWYHRMFQPDATALYAALGPADLVGPQPAGALPPPIV